MGVKLPNFLIIGAMRSGTTSLWRYLRQHPQIYMPDLKEPRFLASVLGLGDEFYRFQRVCKSHPACTFDDYIQLFRKARDENAIGEASPHYLYLYRSTIPTIKHYLGDVKIIIILRNPADRAFSAYKHALLISNRRSPFKERLPFEKCLEIEEERRKNEVWPMMNFYKDVGFYHKQVEAYMQNFTRVKICLYDDLSNNTRGLVKDIFAFLGVDSSFNPDVDIKHNESPHEKMFLREFVLDYEHPLKKVLRPIFLRSIGMKSTERLINFFKRGKQIEMKPETRNYLIDLYNDDILKLQDLIQRDLSGWIEKSEEGPLIG
jgi:hypothetical protein